MWIRARAQVCVCVCLYIQNTMKRLNTINGMWTVYPCRPFLAMLQR